LEVNPYFRKDAMKNIQAASTTNQMPTTRQG
jgi:hypothetical protein